MKKQSQFVPMAEVIGLNDQGRETFIIIRNGAYIEDRNTRVMYFEMLTKMFELTKKMQEEILHQN